MDKRKSLLSAYFWIMCLFTLILDTKTVIRGAGDGIDLCIRVLIPSIFPFLVICSMVTASLPPSMPFLRSIGRLLKLPAGAEDLFFLGLLGGYPVGAAMVSNAVRSKQISARDGARLMAFCSNPGPSFLFGMGAVLFPSPFYCAALWLIQILSAAIVGILTPGSPSTSRTNSVTKLPMDRNIRRSISTMAIICAWVVLFRIVITVLERWTLWFLPESAQIIVRGLLELANGIVSLQEIQNLGQRMVLFSMLLSFGGLCVWMQTISVADGVPTKYYLPGKITQCAISVLLTFALQVALPAQQRAKIHPLFLVIGIIVPIFYSYIQRKLEKRSRNSDLIGV